MPLLLWVLLVAPPSSMKSEVIKAARALAASLDMQERERYRRDVAAAEVGAMLGWRPKHDKGRGETGAGRGGTEGRAAAPARLRRHHDREVADILGANPGGCAVIREELSGWLGGLGRYTRERHGRGRPRFLLRHARRLAA